MFNVGKPRMMALPGREKVDDIFSCFDTTHRTQECCRKADRQMDIGRPLLPASDVNNNVPSETKTKTFPGKMHKYSYKIQHSNTMCHKY